RPLRPGRNSVVSQLSEVSAVQGDPVDVGLHVHDASVVGVEHVGRVDESKMAGIRSPTGVEGIQSGWGHTAQVGAVCVHYEQGGTIPRRAWFGRHGLPLERNESAVGRPARAAVLALTG